jgi:hypothetical protein
MLEGLLAPVGEAASAALSALEIIGLNRAIHKKGPDTVKYRGKRMAGLKPE